MLLDALDDLEARAGEAARLLKLLANEQRLILLCHLAECECSVAELADYSGLSSSATSQHLARMRAEGLVSARRDAQVMWYRLADDNAARLMAVLCDIYGGTQKENEAVI